MVTSGYLVCATPRSGSGLLCGCLAATGVLGDPDEFFSRSAVHRLLGEWGGRHPDSTPSAPRSTPGFPYLEHVREAATVDGVLGLKVHWYQIEALTAAGIFTDLLDVFPDDTDVRFVLMRREDVVGQAISTVIADATRVYYVHAGRPAGPSIGYEEHRTVEPVYDYAAITRIIEEIRTHEERWHAFFRRHGAEPETVVYEELCADLPGTVRRVLDHLGADSSVPVPPPQIEKQAGPLNESFRARYLRDRTAVERGCTSGW